MVNLEILPFVGVGLIRFGMPQPEVRRVMDGGSFEVFKRNPSSDLLSDYYYDIGMFVYYGEDECVRALEFHEPADVIFKGVEILNVTAERAYSIVSSLDKGTEVDEDGLRSIGLGVGFYAPNYEDDPMLPVEGVIVFERGYYD